MITLTIRESKIIILYLSNDIISFFCWEMKEDSFKVYRFLLVVAL